MLSAVMRAARTFPRKATSVSATSTIPRTRFRVTVRVVTDAEEKKLGFEASGVAPSEQLVAAGPENKG